MENVQDGDLIICTELSRLGRSLIMIMNVLQHFLEKNVSVWTIKDGYKLGDDIQSKVLAFAFGLSVSNCSCGFCSLKSITVCIECCEPSLFKRLNNSFLGNFSEQVIETSTELPETKLTVALKFP